MTSTAKHPDLSTPYALKPEHIERFRADGFIKLKNVFTAYELAYYGEELTRIVMELNPRRGIPMAERTTYAKAFIQVGNIWTKSDIVKQFSFSQRIARIATELMGTRGVRMWHDQALYKEPGGGFTPWHVDQQYWPMATEKCVTAWIPLQATPMEMGPLSFARGSHEKDIARDMAISDDSEKLIQAAVEQAQLEQVYEPFDLGEVSFHYGWTLHRAGPNTTDKPRAVHTVIYMDRDMTLAEPANDNQRKDWEVWTPSTKVGEVMDDALNPVLYSRG
ncbi:MAG: phytanoyl-CoA dioxygenase family protein [Phycisphaerales bacterium]